MYDVEMSSMAKSMPSDDDDGISMPGSSGKEVRKSSVLREKERKKKHAIKTYMVECSGKVHCFHVKDLTKVDDTH